jgi:hypothetical protein
METKHYLVEVRPPIDHLPYLAGPAQVYEPQKVLLHVAERYQVGGGLWGVRQVYECTVGNQTEWMRKLAEWLKVHDAESDHFAVWWALHAPRWITQPWRWMQWAPSRWDLPDTLVDQSCARAYDLTDTLCDKVILSASERFGITPKMFQDLFGLTQVEWWQLLLNRQEMT